MLRFTYDTKMRLVEGQPGIPVRWHRCRPGAKPVPYPHGYRSRIWEEGWRLKTDSGEFGEIYGLSPKWVEPSNDPNLCLEGPYWPERYRPGVSSRDADTFPALRRDAGGGYTGCCEPAKFLDLVKPRCLLPRLTKRLRVTAFNPPGGDCEEVNGTEVLMLLGGDGVWRGDGEFGSSGIPIELDFPYYPNPLSTCYLRWRFPTIPPSEVLFAGDPLQIGIEIVPNPPMILNWHISDNHLNPGFFPCGFPVIIPPWRINLRALADDPE